MAPRQNRTELLVQFSRLPDDAIVDEKMAAAYRNKQPTSLQRERWAGTGPKYIKDGALVGYRKLDLIDYVERLAVSPTEAA